MKVIAPLQLDGGTKLALAFDPNEISPAWKDELERLRKPRSPEEKRALKEAGGLLTWLHVDGRNVVAKVSIAGDWRERITLHVPDRVYVYIDLHAGKLSMQFKAKELWAFGYANAACWWCDCFSRLLLRRAVPTLEHADVDWHTTGIELCCDFVGLPSWRIEDLYAFVGARKLPTHPKHPDCDVIPGSAGAVQTINLGTRVSRVSACLYDKDEQLYSAKPERSGGTPRGDDSTYRAVHLANGWDGESNRQRVEFRFHGEALQLEHVYSRMGRELGTGELWDFRRPSVLADRSALALLWRKASEKKRLIDLKSATRRERCVMDERWRRVVEAAEAPSVDLSQVRWRREVPADTHAVRLRLRTRALARTVRQVAALVDLPTNTPLDLSRVLHFSETLLSAEEGPDWRDDYQETKRAEYDAFMREEIRNRGSPMARAVLAHILGVAIDTSHHLEEFFSEDELERMLARKRAKARRDAD